MDEKLLKNLRADIQIAGGKESSHVGWSTAAFLLELIDQIRAGQNACLGKDDMADLGWERAEWNAPERIRHFKIVSAASKAVQTYRGADLENPRDVGEVCRAIRDLQAVLQGQEATPKDPADVIKQLAADMNAPQGELPEAPTDWTKDDAGRSNSSPAFLKIQRAMAEILGGCRLDERPMDIARTILSNLAHQHHLAPNFGDHKIGDVYRTPQGDEHQVRAVEYIGAEIALRFGTTLCTIGYLRDEGWRRIRRGGQ